MLHCNNKLSVTSKEISVTRYKIDYYWKALASNFTIKNSFAHVSGPQIIVSGILQYSKQFILSIKIKYRAFNNIFLNIKLF